MQRTDPGLKASSMPVRSRLGGAVASSLVFLAVIWIVHFCNVLSGYRLISFGIWPHHVEGLRGIFLAPFIHLNFAHLVANSSIAAILLFILSLSGKKELWVSSVIIALISGLGVWLTGSANSVHVGASGLIYGWLSYLVVRGFFTKATLQILVGVILGFTYWGLVWGILPGREGISWEGHLFGMIGGIIAAWSGLARPARKKKEPSVMGVLKS